MIKKIINLSLFILLFSAIFSCHSQDKPLKIGTLYFNPPFEQTIQNKKAYFGFNIEIITALCQVMNRTCELVPMRFDKLLVALNNKKIDAMIVGVSLMPENPQNYLFSYPYFISEAFFMTLRQNHLDSLNNKTVGIVKNTLFPLAKRYDIIFSKKRESSDPDQYEINFKFYNNLPVLLTALNTHQVDAVILDAGAAMFWISQSGNIYQQIGPVIRMKKGMAIMTTKDNSQLIQQINQALLTIEKNQVLLKIYEQYWQLITPEYKSTGYLMKQLNNKYNFIISSPGRN